MARRVLLVAAIFAALSCGPGLESLHESNIRFEHCYRLDMDPATAPTHRWHCWRNWSTTYAYGQPRDRIEYARRRIIALESGDSEVVSIYTKPEPRSRVFSEMGVNEEPSPAAAPVPTSAHAPPPSMAPAPPRSTEKERGKAKEPSKPKVKLPGEPCSETCETAFAECKNACEKTDENECPACREDYRGCMRRCFE